MPNTYFNMEPSVFQNVTNADYDRFFDWLFSQYSEQDMPEDIAREIFLENEAELALSEAYSLPF